MKSHGWSPAATVLLLNRQVPRDLSVLLLKRPNTMRAFPGFWAFPGGSVSPGDHDASVWFPRIRPEPSALIAEMLGRDKVSRHFTTGDYLARMEVEADPPDEWLPKVDPETLWAYWIAGVREVHEELGIALGGWPANRGVLDLATLRYLGRIAPPPSVRHRFDTRFFAAAIDPPLSIQVSAEVDDVRWVPVKDALEGPYPLAKPTRYALICLDELGTLDAVMEGSGRD